MFLHFPLNSLCFLLYTMYTVQYSLQWDKKTKYSFFHSDPMTSMDIQFSSVFSIYYYYSVLTPRPQTVYPPWSLIFLCVFYISYSVSTSRPHLSSCPLSFPSVFYILLQCIHSQTSSILMSSQFPQWIMCFPTCLRLLI